MRTGACIMKEVKEIDLQCLLHRVASPPWEGRTRLQTGGAEREDAM